MNVTFTNGTAYQHEIVLRALDSLLHLDLDRFDFDAAVSFVPNPEPSVHNEFAYTSGSPPHIELRTDFPHFAPEALWGDIRFANETVIHELAHALLGVLPIEVLGSILELFDSDIDEFNSDPDRPWVDRIREGIAETFKDAFLPERLRAYANRTNVKLPITKYPAFRAIFRAGLTGGGHFCYTYGSTDFRVDLTPFISIPTHRSDNDPVAHVFYNGPSGGGGFGVDMSQFDESGELPFSIQETGGAT